MSTALVWIFLFIAGFISCWLLYLKSKSFFRKRRYLVRKTNGSILKGITKGIAKVDWLDHLLCKVAIKISVLNDSSYDKNKEKAVVALGLIILLGVLNFSIIMPAVKIVWYLYLFYLILGTIFIACILYTLKLVLKMHFTKLLPDAYKILNSRFTTEGDILKAIDSSLVDFNPAVRREMKRIRNVLRKNDREKIEQTFSQMENVYRNEHLTLLLNLIHQAYYKGGKDSIKNQFELVTEEILIEIENQKDLALTSRMYVVISLFLPLGIRWLENFNERALGNASLEFYSSPAGIGIKIILLLSLLIYIVSLLLLERIE